MPISLGTAKASPDRISYGTYDLLEHPTGGIEQLPVVIAQGSPRGPVFWLTAGIHGNEHAGLQVLHLLQLHGPSTPRDLARWACITTGGMTVVLDRLEKDGYVKRQANPADRRSCIVHLILESLRELEGVYKSKGELLSGVIERYKDRDLRLLIEFFEWINGGGVDE